MYATVEEIRAASTRLSAIKSASKADLEEWMDEATTEINDFCSQDFSFEPQKEKVLHVEDPFAPLPKPLTGYITATNEGGDPLSGGLEVYSSELMLGYEPFNAVPATATWPAERPHVPKRRTLVVRGDWGYAPSEVVLLVRFANELRTAYAKHLVASGVHVIDDAVNVVSSPEATDEASALSLLEELRTVVGSHLGDETVHTAADGDIHAPSAATLEDAMTLAKDLRAHYNQHIGNGSLHVVADTSNYVYGSLDAPILPRSIKRVFIRLVQRLAIRSCEDDKIQVDSAYSNETTGDGYSYDLSNGTLRNLLRPEDVRLLWPYVNHGQVVM